MFPTEITGEIRLRAYRTNLASDPEPSKVANGLGEFCLDPRKRIGIQEQDPEKIGNQDREPERIGTQDREPDQDPIRITLGPGADQYGPGT